jgi:hypothetical protein
LAKTAVPHLKRALKFAGTELGKDDLPTLLTAEELARAFGREGECQAVFLLFQRVLSGREENLAAEYGVANKRRKWYRRFRGLRKPGGPRAGDPWRDHAY